MPKPPKVSIGCEPTAEGRIRIFLNEGKSKHGIRQPSKRASKLSPTPVLAYAMWPRFSSRSTIRKAV
jgi:hypothetical protein